jgi:hypothetical protein
MRFGTRIVVSLVLAPWARAAAADTLAYVRTSSQLERDSLRDRYHPLNLLDDDASTMWCEGAEGLGEGEEIRFYFKKAQRIDRIIVGPAAETGRLILRVRVSDGVNSIRIDLSDVYAERILKRPLFGSNYTVSIEQVGGPNEGSRLGNDVACLSEVFLYWKKRPFGGRTPVSKLKYNKNRDRVLGRWNGEPMGAPEKFLVFGLDGTWEWSFVPLLGGRRERMTGEYRFRAGRLLMRRGETGRWADIGFRYRRVEVDPDTPGAPLGDYDSIRINRALHDKLHGEYNNAEF